MDKEINNNYPYWSKDFQNNIRILKLELVFEILIFFNCNDIFITIATQLHHFYGKRENIGIIIFSFFFFVFFKLKLKLSFVSILNNRLTIVFSYSNSAMFSHFLVQKNTINLRVNYYNQIFPIAVFHQDMAWQPDCVLIKELSLFLEYQTPTLWGDFLCSQLPV